MVNPGEARCLIGLALAGGVDEEVRPMVMEVRMSGRDTQMATRDSRRGWVLKCPSPDSRFA